MTTLKELLEGTQEPASLVTPVGELSDEDLQNVDGGYSKDGGQTFLKDPLAEGYSKGGQTFLSNP